MPKIPNAVNVVLTVGKFLGMVDEVMDKTAYVRLAIAAQAIRANDAVRHDFLSDNRYQSIGFGIVHEYCIDFIVPFRNTENDHLARRPHRVRDQ